ncbi:MAG TPA: HPF/RaiA family ribosome-associated protein [Candidatus Acidoferrales bacterium]|nr:HPF/RaiA family ribosome-associated protein [Candidatus Acidoferrales bacterium]
MKITFSHIDVELRRFVEEESERPIQKLNTLLKHFTPDLVILHASLEKMPRKTEYSCSLNLTLPTGALHATGLGPDVRASLKAAFAEIEIQVKKHKQKLRKDYEWKRKRPRAKLLSEPREAFGS